MIPQDLLKCPEGFNKYSSMGHTSNQAKFQERTRIVYEKSTENNIKLIPLWSLTC